MEDVAVFKERSSHQFSSRSNGKAEGRRKIPNVDKRKKIAERLAVDDPDEVSPQLVPTVHKAKNEIQRRVDLLIPALWT